jgi:hypothetical protein
MINKDKFDSLEAVLSDKGLFSHLATALVTFGASLGVEMGITYAHNPEDSVSLAILIICGGAGVLGAGFGILTYIKGSRYKKIRQSLFDDQNLLADETILHVSDGTAVRIDNLNSSGSSGSQ